MTIPVLDKLLLLDLNDLLSQVLGQPLALVPVDPSVLVLNEPLVLDHLLILNEPLVLDQLLVLVLVLSQPLVLVQVDPLVLVDPDLPLLAVGSVDVWSLETGGEPILHYQVPAEVRSLSLSPDFPVLASVSQNQVRLDQADDRGYWRTLCRTQIHDTVGLIGLCYYYLVSHTFTL